MCGIAGIVHADPRYPGRSRSCSGRMTDVLAHRGPDADGLHSARARRSGHRRLSIIDLADRRPADLQRGPDEGGDPQRRDLQLPGAARRARGARPPLRHALRHRGRSSTPTRSSAPAAWRGCAGMFAFALWDAPRRRLLLARDRVGKKPLYYAHGRRAAASSPPSSRRCSRTRPSSARSTWRRSTTISRFGAVPAPAHDLPGHRAAPPRPLPRLGERRGRARHRVLGCAARAAHGLAREARGARGVRRRLRRGGARPPDQRRAARRVPERRRRLQRGGRGDGPRCPTGPVVTTSVGFAERAFSEAAARARGRPGGRAATTTRSWSRPQAAEVLPRLVWHLDEPFADSSALPTYYVSQAARERVTVALSGDGGDEVFAGYQRRYGMNRLGGARAPLAARAGCAHGVLGPLGRAYPKADWLPRPLRARYFLQNLGTTFERAYFADLCLLPDGREGGAPVAGASAAAWAATTPSTASRGTSSACAGLDPLSRLLYVDLKTWLANDILVKVDRMSMAHSLEVRVAPARPPGDRVRGDGAVGPQVPRPHLEVPAQAASRGPRARARRSTARSRASRFPLAPVAPRRAAGDGRGSAPLAPRRSGAAMFGRSACARSGSATSAGSATTSPQLWALMVLELWHRTFVDQAQAP